MISLLCVLVSRSEPLACCLRVSRIFTSSRYNPLTHLTHHSTPYLPANPLSPGTGADSSPTEPGYGADVRAAGQGGGGPAGEEGGGAGAHQGGEVSRVAQLYLFCILLWEEGRRRRLPEK